MLLTFCHSHQTDEWKENISVKELREIATNAIEGFKADHPKLTSEATGYVDFVTDTTKKIFEQIKNIAESDESKQAKELTEKLLEQSKQSLILIAATVESLDVYKEPQTE